VHPVERVEVHRTLARGEPVVRGDRVRVRGNDAAVVAAQHVDVGRHVLQVAAVGDEIPEPVGDPQRAFWLRRHFHQVDVHVQDAWVCSGLGLAE